MSIPGLGIPGLASIGSFQQEIVPTVSAPRIQILEAQSEWRFESSFASPITVKLFSGAAEFFGTELAPATTYTFKGTKGAIYTWQGCHLEIAGDEEGFVSRETPLVQYVNVHAALETVRQQAIASRVLVLGPQDSGKTSLIKTLTAYAVKSGRQPLVVNLDPTQAILGVPGSLTATVMASLADIEEGYGSSPISGPSNIPVKMPLVYHFGCASAGENQKLYKALLTRLGLSTKAKLSEDIVIQNSGILIDTPGSIASGKTLSYDLIQHILYEFGVNTILVLGSEKLSSDLQKRFADPTASKMPNPINVLRLDKSEGCVNRDEAYMKALRQAQIKEYFFGHGQISLSPHTMHVNLSELSVYRILSSSVSSSAFNPGGSNEDEDDFYEPSAGAAQANALLERITPSAKMQNSLLAVTFAPAGASLESVRDAAVMGYLYVAEVDEMRQKAKLLSPVGGAVPRNAMVWGTWPEGVVGLVS